MREIAAAPSPAGLTATKLAEATAWQPRINPGRSACELCPTRHISANKCGQTNTQQAASRMTDGSREVAASKHDTMPPCQMPEPRCAVVSSEQVYLAVSEASLGSAAPVQAGAAADRVSHVQPITRCRTSASLRIAGDSILCVLCIRFPTHLVHSPGWLGSGIDFGAAGRRGTVWIGCHHPCARSSVMHHGQFIV